MSPQSRRETRASDAVVSITAHVPEDAMSAGLLGTERSATACESAKTVSSRRSATSCTRPRTSGSARATRSCPASSSAMTTTAGSRSSNLRYRCMAPRCRSAAPMRSSSGTPSPSSAAAAKSRNRSTGRREAGIRGPLGVRPRSGRVHDAAARELVGRGARRRSKKKDLRAGLSP